MQFAASLDTAANKSTNSSASLGQFQLANNLPFACLCPIEAVGGSSGLVVGATNGAVAVLLRPPHSIALCRI